MIEFFQNFHFLRPWVLLFLFLPFVFYMKKIYFHNSISSWENVCDKNLLELLLSKTKKYKKLSLTKYIYIGLISTIIAAAGPCWKKIEIPAFVIENPSMFVISLAPNMNLEDITPSRLERAKYMISDISKAAPEGQFGLEVYSQEPYIITPFTDDISIIKNLLPQIVPDIVPDQGDRLDRAVALAIEKFKSAGNGHGNIIMFASDIGQRLDLAIEQAEKAARMKYTLNVVDTSFSGNEKLEMLAQKGNGVYISVKETNLQKLLSKIVASDKDKLNISKNLQSQFLDYGYYLVFISLLCLLPFFRRGIFIFFFFCFFSFNANASFFLNDNQEGLRFLKNQQYDLALKKFKDPFWKSIVFYKQNKNEEALKELSHPKDDLSFYNKGVILTRLCKYKEAIEAFEAAYKLNPKNEDALYNKQVLDKLFDDAKKDPSLLECQNDQQDQQNQQNQNKDQNDNSSQDKNNSNSESNSSSNSNSEQDQSTNPQEQENQEQNQSTDPQEQENQKNSSEQKQNNNDKSSQDVKSQETDSNNKQENNSDNQQKNSSSDNKESSPQDKTGDSDEQASSQQKTSQAKDSSDETEEEAVGTSIKNKEDAPQGDEEVLAKQRQYREIPENVGGLLREFIKKEYSKDRYHDENK